MATSGLSITKEGASYTTILVFKLLSGIFSSSNESSITSSVSLTRMEDSGSEDTCVPSS